MNKPHMRDWASKAWLAQPGPTQADVVCLIVYVIGIALLTVLA